MKSFLRNFLLACLPLIVGLGVYVTLQVGFRPVPVLVFKADIGSSLAVVGAVLSLVLVAAVLGWWAAERRGERLLAEARRSEEDARRRFIRRLDHELKNPLTGLRAALANLNGIESSDPGCVKGEEGLLADAGRVRALSDAQHQSERLSRLVADLRKLAELEERPIERVPVDLGEVLEEVVDAACSLPQYEGRTVNLNISRVPWPLPPITGDRDLLGLAFYNLVENALKYAAPEDVVEVRAVEDGRWLSVEVADTGPGISEEDLPRVFEELYRGTNARGFEGSGLGLALVRRVIDRHGGEISLRSRQGGGQKGTIFRVRIPIK